MPPLQLLTGLKALPSSRLVSAPQNNGQVTASALLLNPQAEVLEICVVPLTRQPSAGQPPGALMPLYMGATDWATQIQTFETWKSPPSPLGFSYEGSIAFDFSAAAAAVHAVAVFFLVWHVTPTFDTTWKLEKLPWLKDILELKPLSPLLQQTTLDARLQALTKGLKVPMVTAILPRP